MIRFGKISKSAPDYNSSTKTLKFVGEANSRVYSPYDGVVVSNYDTKCGSGYLLIQHTIQDNKYYSEFCNIGKVVVRKNDSVMKGSIIGYSLTSNDEVNYSILNDKNKKIDPTIFLNGYQPKTLKPQTNKNWENMFNHPPKKKPKTKDRTDDVVTDTKKGKSIYDYSLLDLALSPINLLKKGGEYVGKTLKDAKKGVLDFSITKKDDESLNEDIKRIKKLL